MARSNHAVYTAAERFERQANRRQAAKTRRLNTRTAIIRAEVAA